MHPIFIVSCRYTADNKGWLDGLLWDCGFLAFARKPLESKNIELRIRLT